MALHSRQQGLVSILVPTGRLGIIEMNHLKTVLKNLLNRGRKKVLVNLEHVPQLAWSTIGDLIENSKEFRSKKGEFKLSGLNESLETTFRSLGAHKKVNLYDSEKEALCSFGTSR